jgi:phosphohistidine swiveling domain-containing protein
LVSRATRYQALKEEAKHHGLRELALLRKALLALDRQLGSRGDVFYLRVEEVRELLDPERLPRLRERIAARKAEEEAFRSVQLPAKLCLGDLEALSPERGAPAAHRRTNGTLAGTLVAGGVEACGVARVITRAEDLDSFRDGEILVARFTEPTWTPLFPRAAGVVTEVGGRLSHAAIVAREFNVTAIVGVDNALDAIRTGEVVRLHLDGSVTKESDRRQHHRLEVRREVRLRVALRRQDALLQALLVNVSLYGALVNTDEDLPMGLGVVVQLADGSESRAHVVRRDGQGSYALRFAEPVAIGELVGTLETE